MRVLIACERSLIVADAFAAKGHDVWSCDLEPSYRPSNRHIQCDVREILNDDWDLLMVAHPPCTRLCASGVRWLTGEKLPKDIGGSYSEAVRAQFRRMTDDEKRAFLWDDLDKGCELFSAILNAPIARKAIENPKMHKHAKARIRNFRPHSQSVQPWHFGHSSDGPDNVKKQTLLWTVGLPTLRRTGTLDGSTARPEIHHASPGQNRSEVRSRFFPGIAKAMADQWGHIEGVSRPVQMELPLAA